MNLTRKSLIIGAEAATVSLPTSQLRPPDPSPGRILVGDLVQTDDELIRDGGPLIKNLSQFMRAFCLTQEQERRIDLLGVMRQEVRGLRSTFSAANFEALANFAMALERLFNVLATDVGALNVSTLKTISHAVDFLTQTASSNLGHEEMARTPIRMLAVDDDPVCLRTLMLLASNNKGVSLVACDGAEPAFRLLKTDKFDLILSDILMPRIERV